MDVQIVAMRLSANAQNNIDAECAYKSFDMTADKLMSVYTGPENEMRAMASYLTQCVADGQAETFIVTRKKEE